MTLHHVRLASGREMQIEASSISVAAIVAQVRNRDDGNEYSRTVAVWEDGETIGNPRRHWLLRMIGRV